MQLIYTAQTVEGHKVMYGKPSVAIFNSLNFICSFVLCAQYAFKHPTRYSIFNFAFNIQLFILYSIPYSPIQLSIQQFQPFIQHSTLILPWVPEAFLAYGGNFRCWPKAEAATSGEAARKNLWHGAVLFTVPIVL